MLLYANTFSLTPRPSNKRLLVSRHASIVATRRHPTGQATCKRNQLSVKGYLDAVKLVLAFWSNSLITHIVPKTGPQIPAHIVALATKAPSKRELVSKVAKKKPDVATTATSATCPRGRKPRFVDIEVSDTRATRAAKLLGAKRTVPHQYTTIKINLNKANTLRVKLTEANAGPISLGDLIVRAASIALRKQGEQQISIGIKQPSDEFGFESFMLAKAAGTGVGNIGARLTSLGDATVPIRFLPCFTSTT